MVIELTEIIEALAWFPDQVNGAEEKYKKMVKQLRDDHEKARKYEKCFEGLNDEMLKSIKITFKLRELIEKQKIITKAILSYDSPNKEELQRLLNLFDYLLEASKK